jgi:hypothetical protein
MPVLLALLAGCCVFFWIAFSGGGEADADGEEERLR